MHFFPVNLCLKLDSSTVCRQTDILCKGGIADLSGYFQHAFQTICFHGNRNIFCRLNFLIDIIGINIPCIKHTWYIFVQMEAVHGICCELSSGLFQYERNHLAFFVYDCFYLAVFHGKSTITCFYCNCLFFHLTFCRNQRNCSTGRYFYGSFHSITDLLYLYSDSIHCFRSVCKCSRKLYKHLSRKT